MQGYSDGAEPSLVKKGHSFQFKAVATKEQLISQILGGKIQLNGCGIAFPAGGLKHGAPVKISVRWKVPSSLREKYVLISPSLSYDLSHIELLPGFEIEVEMSAYCRATNPVPIVLLRKECDTKDWVVEKEMTLETDRLLKFKTSSLSGFFCWAFMKTMFHQPVKFVLCPSLFSDAFGNLKVYITVNDQTLVDALEKKHKDNGYESGLIMPNLFFAQRDQSVHVELQCPDTQAATLGDVTSFDFSIEDAVEGCRMDGPGIKLQNVAQDHEFSIVRATLTLEDSRPHRYEAVFRWDKNIGTGDARPSRQSVEEEGPAV